MVKKNAIEKFMIDIFGERKKKMKLDQEKFKLFFYTILDAISEEWKEISDKKLKIIQEQRDELIKENKKLNAKTAKMANQHNNYIQQDNIVHSLYQMRIQKLETMLLDKKEAEIE